MPQAVKLIETERRLAGAGAGGGENGELVFHGFHVSVGRMKKVLEMGRRDGYPTT